MNINEVLDQLDELYAQGDLNAVQSFFDEKVRDAQWENDTGAVLTLYNEMEGFYRNTGRADFAVEISGYALQLIADMGLEDTIYHATTLINGATAARMAGKNADALKLYFKAEEILKQLDKGQTYNMATLYNNVSQVYMELQETETALKYLQKALPIVETLPGTGAEAAITRENIALAHMSLGDMAAAKAMLDAAAAYFETEKGQNDRHLGSFYSSMAEYYYQNGDAEASIAWYERSAEAILRFFGANAAYQTVQKNISLLKGN